MEEISEYFTHQQAILTFLTILDIMQSAGSDVFSCRFIGGFW